MQFSKASTPSRALLALLLASTPLIACGQATAPDQPVTRTATPNRPSPDAAAPEDIAFAKRLSNAFKSVAHNVEPSVVHVTQRNRVYQRDWFGQPIGSSVMDTGMGSGFVVSKDGYIITNNHVIVSGDRAAEQIKVRMHDGSEIDAKLVGRDELTDLAVLQINPADVPAGLTPVTFGDSDILEVGEWVVAIGSPFGLSNTVTAGIVSAKGRSITPRETGRVHEDFIQTDAAINPGNSGGPLLNLQGEVVGINSAIASRSGGYQGIGFAIPSNIAKAVMENIVSHGRVVRGWLGVDLADAPQSGGVTVETVQEDSPADKAGLRSGDIITKFQGRPVNEMRLRSAIALSPPGTRAAVEVLRDGKPRELTVTLADQSSALGNVDVPALGARVRTITPEISQALRQRNLKGVIVIEVDPDSRAAAADLQPGDVISGYQQGAAGGQVASAEQFQKLAAAIDYSNGLRLNVTRTTNGFVQRGYVVVQDQ
jgi:serine protease Do